MNIAEQVGLQALIRFGPNLVLKLIIPPFCTLEYESGG